MSRIGVFVCHCGMNIAKTVRVSELAEYAATLPDVVVAGDYKFMCSTRVRNGPEGDPGEPPGPGHHRRLFASDAREGPSEGDRAAGFNQYLLTFVKRARAGRWVTTAKTRATAKAKALVTRRGLRAGASSPSRRAHST
jgi:heterodisulfide reductase subunit A